MPNKRVDRRTRGMGEWPGMLKGLSAEKRLCCSVNPTVPGWLETGPLKICNDCYKAVQDEFWNPTR